MTPEQVIRKVHELVGSREAVRHQVDSSQQELESAKLDLEAAERAQAIIQRVAQETQKALEYQVSELVSLALESIFPRPYKLSVTFEPKRGRTECLLRFVDRKGNQLEPMEASGYGPVDVASYALRLTLWALAKNRTRAVMILDEPFKFVSKDLQPRVAAMMSDLSKRLKVQHIIATHEEALAEVADAVFHVQQNKAGVSTATRE